MIAALGTGWGVTGSAAQGVEGTPPTHLSRETLAAAPVLRLVEPVELFAGTGTDSTTRIRGMAVAEAGAVHLFDVDRKEVRMLDGEGRTVRTVPIPLASYGMTFARDSVLVLTTSLGTSGPITQLHVFDVAGTSEPRSDTLPVEFTGGQFLVRPTRSGWVLSYPVMEHPPDARDEPLADSVIFADLDAVSMETRRKVSLPAGPPRYAVTPNWSLYEVMGHVHTFDVARDGRIYATVEDGYVIDIFGSGGTLERRVVGEVEPVPFTDEEFLAWLDTLVRRQRERARERDCDACDEAADRLERHGPRVGYADTRPVLGSIEASEGGRFLVRRLDLEAAVQTPTMQPSAPSGPDHVKVWDLIDMNEGVLGRLRTPPGGDVTEFSWPHVYVTFGENRDHARIRFRIEGAESG